MEGAEFCDLMAKPRNRDFGFEYTGHLSADRV